MDNSQLKNQTVYYRQLPISGVVIFLDKDSTTTGKASIDGRSRIVVYKSRIQGKNKGSMQWHCDDY